MRSAHTMTAPLVLLASFGIASSANAQSSGLEDLVGARAGQAELAVTNRGYRFIRAEPSDDRTYTFWWSDGRRQCVTIATMDGRYSSITPSPAPDCRQNAASQLVPTHPPAKPPPPVFQIDPRFSQVPNRPVSMPSDSVNVDGRAVQLGLVCFGDGSKDGIAAGPSWRWNDRRERYERAYDYRSTTINFDASVTIQLWNGGGRIKLPRALVPPLNSRGDDGWWQLQDLQAGPDLITAVYRLNGLNKPRLTIDRRTGRINITGAADYSFRGTCNEAGTRRFQTGLSLGPH